LHLYTVDVYVTEMGNCMSIDDNNLPDSKHQLVLPDAPLELTGPVKAWSQPVLIRTYEPESPNRNPMFLEKRVYQGSSGKIYPLPFIDRIASSPTDRMWDAIHIENEYVRLMILPEIGGRIHVGYDKIGKYDFFYRQNVIKPALVGLAGPWVSGGVEFNWPQHHRPGTHMPVDTKIDQGPDGEVTIWCSDHDPIFRLKGMHGVCLRPDSSIVELKVRLFNRTQFTQTFLWWANVAVRVHEKYQSFFPTDVRFVADHAKRAITSFPLSDRPYYGVDYPERAKNGVPEDEKPRQFQPDGSYASNDLSWYANIPVPTSYMIAGSSMDFFGGYDHHAQAGFVHVADHHISPGKKQWTWGNHEFGYAWDRNLTDADGPYIELMAGVYTDNQPDFSYLAPWETKTFTQVWYPIRDTGVPQMANDDAAIHLDVAGSTAHIAVAVTRNIASAEIQLLHADKLLQSWALDLRVDHTFRQSIELEKSSSLREFAIKVLVNGKVLLAYEPANIPPATPPEAAEEPGSPDQIETIEELYLTGLHLNQYRHATRKPELYWREALRRDPNESRCLNAMGLWHLRRGELEDAADFFKKALKRITRLNPNPYDGEPLYNLGITLRYLGEPDGAYDAFFKSTWNAAWRGPAYFALAEIDCTRGEWRKAEGHLRRSLRVEADNLNARNLLAYVLRATERTEEADCLVKETLELDPLDAGALLLQGAAPHDGQTRLDVAFDLLRAGLRDQAIQLLRETDLIAAGSASVMILLTLADLEAKATLDAEEATLRQLDGISHDFCFPSRIEELLVLEHTIERHPDRGLAAYLLGNLLYDRHRHTEAIEAWERASALEPRQATVWRNLGIAYFNVRKDVDAAVRSFDHAFAIDQEDGRILYERDQLWKRTSRSPEDRLAELLKHPMLVESRDDISVELASLYNQLNQPEKALQLILARRFQPWEGGEGLVLTQFVRAELLLGRSALASENPRDALEHFLHALNPPSNLGEAKHLLVNQSEVFFWLGRTYETLGQEPDAKKYYLKAVQQKGDFQQMSVRTISDTTFWSGLALQQLGLTEEAKQLFGEIGRFADAVEKATPKIEYFATSLPAMLLFEDDLEKRNGINATFLKAQALYGLGQVAASERLLRHVLEQDANHSGAHDLLALCASLGEKAEQR
jgi:tetratricopeptide (TPR) repeat protein